MHCSVRYFNVFAGYISYTVLHKHAREEVLTHAGMMMEAALAIRGYTIKEIRPLLTLQMKRDFLPQSVPSYAATQNFNSVRENHPEYTYKEAALNPTNPRDQATDWEADIIQAFRNKEFLIFIASLIAIFVTIFIVINIMLNQIVVKRVRAMAHISDEVSIGHQEVPEFSDTGKDEIADLSQSFNRMRRSLEKAMQMLGE